MLPVARVSKLFGVEGEVILNLYTTFPDDYTSEEPLFATIDSLAVPLFCDTFERRGTSSARARFADIDTARRIEEFIGKELCIDNQRGQRGQQESDDDEFYMEDLIGFAVTADGRKGTLSDYYDSDANPLFGITLDGEEILVPAVEEFITHIDFDKRTITMTLPEGLVEMNN